MYALRTNINVAIGAMVKNHTVFVDGVETEEVKPFSFLLYISRLQNWKQMVILLSKDKLVKREH